MIDDLRWWEQGNCRNAPPSVKRTFTLTDTSRYHRGSRAVGEQLGDTVNARTYCDTCPVTDACLRELWDDQYAVAGGTVPAQRRGRKPEALAS